MAQTMAKTSMAALKAMAESMRQARARRVKRLD